PYRPACGLPRAGRGRVRLKTQSTAPRARDGEVPSRRFVYGVALILGLAFTGILQSLAWIDVIDRHRAAFILQAASVRGTAFGNARAAHDALNAVAAILGAPSSSRLSGVAAQVLAPHPWITA